MPFNFGALCPYQSLILSKVRTGEPANGVVAAVLDDLQDLLRLDEDDRTLLSRGDPRREGMLEVAGLHYVVRRRASWTLDDQIVDATNHVALIFRRAHALAIHVSEASVRDVITARLDQPRFAGFGRIEPIGAGVLNAAFVDGPAKTLWLSGIHKRTAVKPDAKTLSGVNLRVALDPLADQTYHMTAARSKVHQGRFSAVVGVAPRGSRIWTKASLDWETCKVDIANTLQHLSTVTAGIDAPLPFVAVALDSLEGLGNAYELAIIPPQILTDDPTLERTALQELERQSETTRFTIERAAGPEVEATIHIADRPLGRVTFRLVPRAHGRIGVDADLHDTDDGLADLTHHCRRDGWLRIWFDSGHTYADGGVFRVRFRDYPFDGIRFADFAGYDVTKEKPTHPFQQEEIGRHDSLFCWALHHWPVDGNAGWLVCDDGAMEVADFIHLDDDLLTLIHAKGAKDVDQLRNLSVASYEVVASQVTKCLRWLDEAHLTGNLTAGIQHKVGAAVWHNRHRSNRTEFLRAIGALGTRYRRRVVILQPQITNRNLANSGAARGAEHTRYQQLMTLLNGTRTACQSQGAELLVIGQQVAEQATRGAHRTRP